MIFENRCFVSLCDETMRMVPVPEWSLNLDVAKLLALLVVTVFGYPAQSQWPLMGD